HTLAVGQLMSPRSFPTGSGFCQLQGLLPGAPAASAGTGVAMAATPTTKRVPTSTADLAPILFIRPVRITPCPNARLTIWSVLELVNRGAPCYPDLIS